MAFTVETGAGLSGANSYCSVADADTFHADRGNTAWAPLDTAVKQSLLIKATDYLQNAVVFPWKGKPVSASQGLAWPRTGVTETGGLAVDDNVVPARVIKATADLALVAHTTSLMPVSSAGQTEVKRRKVDVLETEYFQSSSSKDPATDVAQAPYAMGLVAPLLRITGTLGLGATPYAKLPVREEDLTAAIRPYFYAGQHDNHG